MASENVLMEIIKHIALVHKKTNKVPMDLRTDLLNGLAKLKKTDAQAAARVGKAYEKWTTNVTLKLHKAAKSKKKKATKPKKPRRRL